MIRVQKLNLYLSKWNEGKREERTGGSRTDSEQNIKIRANSNTDK